MTPERRRTIFRTAGLVGFGLIVFLVSFTLAFPYDRIKDQVIAIGAAQGYDVQVESAGPVFGVGVALDGVTVRSRPEPGKKASLLAIDKARVHVSPLAQLSGVLDVDVALDTLDGNINAGIRAEKTQGITEISSRQISMAQLPGVKEAINLPLGGTLDFDLDITAPNNRNAEAFGNLNWKWAGAVIGDGKEKLKVAGNPLLAEGLSLPRVRLGDFAGKIVFQKGVGRLQGVGARSADGELRIEGEVRLADPVGYTYLDLYVTFKLSDALLKSADKLQLMLGFAESMGKRSDGFYGFRLTGSPGRMSPPVWMKTSPFTSSGTRASREPSPTAPSYAGTQGLDQSGHTGAPPPIAPSGWPPPIAPERAPVTPPTAAAGGTSIARPEDNNQGEAVRPGANLPRYATSPPKAE